MEEKKYYTICRLLQFINNNYSLKQYNYGGVDRFYRTCSFDDARFPDDVLKVIQALIEIKVVDLYDLSYLKSHNYTEVFYDAELVKKSEKEYAFHYQLSTILFFYIFNHLKYVAKKFLEEIESKEFKLAFGRWIKSDEYLFQYPTHMHNEIFEHLSARIKYFDLLHHLFNWLSDISYHDGSTTIYKVKRIKNCISDLDGFDFEQINLSQFTND
tara:strand:- start:4401 stop:5039 length:639 start_codon:yes stop_codon:yes gene_type:complete